MLSDQKLSGKRSLDMLSDYFVGQAHRLPEGRPHSRQAGRLPYNSISRAAELELMRIDGNWT
jgi:hypothetical protein